MLPGRFLFDVLRQTHRMGRKNSPTRYRRPRGPSPMGRDPKGLPRARNLARTAVVLLVLPMLAGRSMPTWADDHQTQTADVRVEPGADQMSVTRRV